MKIYLVGGAVRDKLLGYPYHERDWVVVGADAQLLLAQGFLPVGKDFPVFLHPKTKEEYALARTERKTAPGYTGFACHASPDVTLEQDLQRRDLTINAIAEDDHGNLIDPYGGQQDLAAKLLRHVSPAFTEDPLRVLRIARFSARYFHLGFQIADATLQLLQAIAAGDELLTIAWERVWKELQRALTERSPQQFFISLQHSHALAVLMPEFCPLAPSAMQALKAGAARQYAAPILFATLFKSLKIAAAKQLCQRLKAPKQYSELALLISQYAADYALASPTAAQQLQLLEQCDALRRPERFADFLCCCQLLFPPLDQQPVFSRALLACQNVDSSQPAALGLKGKAIGDAIRQLRLEAIEHAQ